MCLAVAAIARPGSVRRFRLDVNAHGSRSDGTPAFTRRGHSAEVCPGPSLGGAAIGLPAEPELVLPAFLLAEELKQACRWQALDQLCGLRSGSRLAQRVQQRGHGARVVEAGVGGGAGPASAVTWPVAPASRSASSSLATASGSSRLAWAAGSRSSSAVTWPVAPASRSAPSSLATASGLSRLAWAAGSRSSSVVTWPVPRLRSCPAGWPRRRVVEAGVGGGAVQQRGDLAGGPRLAQRAQQAGHGVRVVEAGVGGGAVGSAVTWPVAPASRSASSRPATPSGSSRLAWAAARGRPAR